MRLKVATPRTGGLLGLWVCGGTLNVFSQIGAVLLIGLAAKNGVLIVEFANQLRDRGVRFREAVLQAASELNVAVELNANPRRLDLNDVHVHRAKELGVPVVISTDAHAIPQLANMSYGVDQARRGWLGPDDVLNTKSLEGLREWLGRRSKAGAA